MITFVKRNLFDSAAQVLTNTVNCVGVMGKGVAIEFKTRYPAMFEDYRERCRRGEVKPGALHLWEDDRTQILESKANPQKTKPHPSFDRQGFLFLIGSGGGGIDSAPLDS